SPNGPPPWPQFHHDAMRTGLYTTPVFTGVDPGPTPAAASAGIELSAPRPNPARGPAQLWYVIPQAHAGETFQLAIYDLAGRQLRVVDGGPARPGRYRADWNLADGAGNRVQPGLYLARFTVGQESRSQKLIVVQ